MTQVNSARVTKAAEGCSPKARSQQKSDNTTISGSSCFNRATSAGSTLPSRTRRCANDSATDDIAIHFSRPGPPTRSSYSCQLIGARLPAQLNELGSSRKVVVGSVIRLNLLYFATQLVCRSGGSRANPAAQA